MNTIERMRAIHSMIEPSEDSIGGSAVLLAKELELFIGLYEAALNAERYLNEAERRLSNLSDSIASLEADVDIDEEY